MLSVIIVNYNTRELLERCLRTVSAETELPCEIIVADNHSSDDSVAAVRRYFPGVQLIENNMNLGFSRANNAAARISHGELLVFLNSDTEIRQRALDKLAGFLVTHKDVGIAGPRMVYQDGRFQLAAGNLPGLLQEMRDKRTYRRLNAGDVELRRRLAMSFQHAREVGWVTGSCLMIRRELFDELGGFDEEIFMYFEDKDLCARAHKLHCKVMAIPDAEIVHLLGGSSAGKDGHLRAIYRQSQRHYYRKHLGWLSNAGLLLYQAISK